MSQIDRWGEHVVGPVADRSRRQIYYITPTCANTSARRLAVWKATLVEFGKKVNNTIFTFTSVSEKGWYWLQSSSYQTAFHSSEGEIFVGQSDRPGWYRSRSPRMCQWELCLCGEPLRRRHGEVLLDLRGDALGFPSTWEVDSLQLEIGLRFLKATFVLVVLCGILCCSTCLCLKKWQNVLGIKKQTDQSRTNQEPLWKTRRWNSLEIHLSNPNVWKTALLRHLHGSLVLHRCLWPQRWRNDAKPGLGGHGGRWIRTWDLQE